MRGIKAIKKFTQFSIDCSHSIVRKCNMLWRIQTPFFLLHLCKFNLLSSYLGRICFAPVNQQIDQAFLAAQKFLLIQYFIIPLSDDDYVLRCNELSVKHCWTTCQSELAVEFLINNFDKCPTTPVAVCRDCFEQEAFLQTLFCFSDI